MSEKFFMVPKWLWRSAKLSVHAKNLLVLLDDHRNDKTSQCNPKREKLAEELALSMPTVTRTLAELLDRGLLYATKGQRGNAYRIAPRSQWRKLLPNQVDQAEKHSASSNRSGARDQVDQADPLLSLYELDPLNYTQPASLPKGGGPEAGRLAELEAVLTQAWPWLPGGPRQPLLEHVAGILGDAPLDEFRVLLESKGPRVKSFGLAEDLARELIARRKSDAAAREKTAAARERAEAADRERDILYFEALLADPRTPLEDQELARSALADLKRSPKSEPAKGAAAKRRAD